MIDRKTFNELQQLYGAEFVGELLDTYFETAPQLIKEMGTTFANGDAAAFSRAAHSLKSNSATFGAIELAALARELEILGREAKLEEVEAKLPSLEATYLQVEDELKAISA